MRLRLDPTSIFIMYSKLIKGYDILSRFDECQFRLQFMLHKPDLSHYTVGIILYKNQNDMSLAWVDFS